MEKTRSKSVLNSQAGISIPEILLSLVLLAVGLTGILAAYPLGMKFAAEIKENTLASIVFQNNTSCLRFRGYYYGSNTTPANALLYPTLMENYLKYFPPTFRESSFENFIPLNPCDRDFFNCPFEIAVNPVHPTDVILHDDTVGELGWEVSFARRRATKWYYSLSLIVVHREGSERYYHFMIGKGYDFSYLLQEDD